MTFYYGNVLTICSSMYVHMLVVTLVWAHVSHNYEYSCSPGGKNDLSNSSAPDPSSVASEGAAPRY